MAIDIEDFEEEADKLSLAFVPKVLKKTAFLTLPTWARVIADIQHSF